MIDAARRARAMTARPTSFRTPMQRAAKRIAKPVRATIPASILPHALSAAAACAALGFSPGKVPSGGFFENPGSLSLAGW